MRIFKENELYFALGLFLTILVLYITQPKPVIVIQHPHNSNPDNIYKDDKGVCYKYIKKFE